MNITYRGGKFHCKLSKDQNFVAQFTRLSNECTLDSNYYSRSNLHTFSSLQFVLTCLPHILFVRIVSLSHVMCLFVTLPVPNFWLRYAPAKIKRVGGVAFWCPYRNVDSFCIPVNQIRLVFSFVKCNNISSYLLYMYLQCQHTL